MRCKICADVYTCSGHDMRPLFVPHFVDSGSAYPDIEVVQEGEINLYQQIQDMAEYCDIDALVKRFNAGDVDALQRAQGFYGDFTNMPRDMRGIYELNSKGVQYFNALPDDVREKFGDYQSFINSSLDALNMIVNPQIPSAAEEIDKDGE